MMLSRVADSMYWMSRYIERAENIARFIDVNALLTMELGDAIHEQWWPLVAVTGDEAIFREKYGEFTRDNVMRFLTFDESYPNSIISCLSSARENARIVREYISTAMWGHLNKFYLMVHDQAKQDARLDAASDFYDEVRLGAQTFVGVTDGTFSHGEGWHFARLARLLERADKTSRILDVRYFLLLPQVTDVGTPIDVVQWSATRTFRSRAEQKLGRLRSELDYTSIDDVMHEGFHEFIDRLQIRLNEVGTAIQETLLTPRASVPPAAGNSASSASSANGAQSQTQSSGASEPPFGEFAEG
jgi:uncharacterized alpha-E superfamily protein